MCLFGGQRTESFDDETLRLKVGFRRPVSCVSLSGVHSTRRGLTSWKMPRPQNRTRVSRDAIGSFSLCSLPSSSHSEAKSKGLDPAQHHSGAESRGFAWLLHCSLAKSVPLECRTSLGHCTVQESIARVEEEASVKLYCIMGEIAS